MKIVIFETESNNFYPVSLTRPVWEMRSGCFSQRERIEGFLERNGFDIDRIYYFTRDYLVPLFKEKYPDMKLNDYSFFESGDDTLFINGSIIPDDSILNLKKNTLMTSNGIPLLGLVESSLIPDGGAEIIDLLTDKIALEKIESNAMERIEFIWDLIRDNGSRITEDFKFLSPEKKIEVDNSLTFTGDISNLYIEGNVKIDPFVCIDVTHGPVVIREGSRINSFSRIEGPCYIGKDCLILGAKVREGCTIGDCCRAGGEIEESIFHGYSNKYHDGFIGHSYIGEWVNLGAMTTNSDLKNDYSEVKVYIPTRRVSTESMKVGSFIGDFVKTSIGTLLITGASIGTGSMAVHAGPMVPYHLPPFSWFIDNRVIDTAFLGDFIESCAKMTARRGVAFTENHKNLLVKLYEMTDEVRKKEIEKWKRMHK